MGKRERSANVCYVKRYKIGNEERTTYIKVGSAFKDSRGRTAIVMEALPLPGTWDGWLYLFDLTEEDKRRTEQRKDVDADDEPF